MSQAAMQVREPRQPDTSASAPGAIAFIQQIGMWPTRNCKPAWIDWHFAFCFTFIPLLHLNVFAVVMSLRKLCKSADRIQKLHVRVHVQNFWHRKLATLTHKHFTAPHECRIQTTGNTSTQPSIQVSPSCHSATHIRAGWHFNVFGSQVILCLRTKVYDTS